MARSIGLAIVVVLITSIPGYAQFGGMGGMGGGMGGMGGMGMAGRFPQQPMEEWNVKAEMDGDRTISGKLSLFSVIVDGDVGQYAIKPEKIKSIRFEKEVKVLENQMGYQIPGTVLTTGDEKVSGIIHVPSWRLKIELGTLTPDPKKLRTVSFLSKTKSKDEAKPVETLEEKK